MFVFIFIIIIIRDGWMHLPISILILDYWSSCNTIIYIYIISILQSTVIFLISHLKNIYINTISFKISFPSWISRIKDSIKKIRGENVLRKLGERKWMNVKFEKKNVILKLHKSFSDMLCNLDYNICYIKKYYYFLNIPLFQLVVLVVRY